MTSSNASQYHLVDNSRFAVLRRLAFMTKKIMSGEIPNNLRSHLRQVEDVIPKLPADQQREIGAVVGLVADQWRYEEARHKHHPLEMFYFYDETGLRSKALKRFVRQYFEAPSEIVRNFGMKFLRDTESHLRS